MKSNFMLTAASAVLSLGAMFFGAHAFANGGESSGGADTVEVRFAKAKSDAIRDLEAITPSAISTLNISQEFKDWLLYTNPTGTVRLSLLQFYSRHIRLAFQDEACLEADKPRSTSFDNSDPNDQKVCVSRSLNNEQHTTQSEAEALLIHEAGHFTGEMNHGFLSDLGQQLVTASQNIQIPCADLPLMFKQHKPVSHCTTSAGVDFVHVRDPRNNALGWQDSGENGRIWYDSIQGNSSQWDAAQFCASKSGEELTSAEAFQTGLSHGLLEVMPQMRSYWYWTSYVGANPNGASCGNGGGFGQVHYFFDGPHANFGLTCGENILAQAVCVSPPTAH